MSGTATIYYDGKCGLCSREIRYYQTIAPQGRFIWHDIAHDPAPLAAFDVSQEAALRRLHAHDAHGRLHVGVDAFALIWRYLPRWRLASFLIRLPVIYQIASFAYRRFADYRFTQLPHCAIYRDEV